MSNVQPLTEHRCPQSVTLQDLQQMLQALLVQVGECHGSLGEIRNELKSLRSDLELVRGQVPARECPQCLGTGRIR